MPAILWLEEHSDGMTYITLNTADGVAARAAADRQLQWCNMGRNRFMWSVETEADPAEHARCTTAHSANEGASGSSDAAAATEGDSDGDAIDSSLQEGIGINAVEVKGNGTNGGGKAATGNARGRGRKRRWMRHSFLVQLPSSNSTRRFVAVVERCRTGGARGGAVAAAKEAALAGSPANNGDNGGSDGGTIGGAMILSDADEEDAALPNGRESLFKRRTDPSSAELYFHYYGQLLHQQNMLQDMVRTSTYYAAILENHSDFKDAVVVDVGAGTAILGIFAVQAGAKKVYAIEASGVAANAQLLIDSNPVYASRIEIIRGKVEEVELPERADVLISEPMGTLLVNERMLETYIIARKRFLKPGGKMFPMLGRMHVSPFSDEYLYTEVMNRAGFWQQSNYYGVDMEALYETAMKAYLAQPVIDSFSPNLLLAAPVSHVIDFTQADETDLHEIIIPLRFVSTSVGRLHGLACWFDVLFNGTNAARWLSTAPGLPTTHWHQLRCLLPNPLVVVAGQELSGTLKLVAHSRQSYNIHISLKVEPPPGQQNSPLHHSVPMEANATLDLKEPYYRLTNVQGGGVPPTSSTVLLKGAGPPGNPSWGRDSTANDIHLLMRKGNDAAAQRTLAPMLTVPNAGSTATVGGQPATGMPPPAVAVSGMIAQNGMADGHVGAPGATPQPRMFTYRPAPPIVPPNGASANAAIGSVPHIPNMPPNLSSTPRRPWG